MLEFTGWINCWIAAVSGRTLIGAGVRAENRGILTESSLMAVYLAVWEDRAVAC